MKKLIILFLMIICLGGCVKLELVPEGFYSTSNFFKTQTDADAATLASYSGMTSQNLYNQFWEVLQSQGTDDAEWGFGRNTNNIDKNQLDKFTFDAGTNLVYQVWFTSYININRTNFAIDGISAMTNLPDNLKNQYIAESRFVRGLMYFNLVRLYGAVPLKLTNTTSLDSLQLARSPVDDVYNQVIQDFQFAEANLPLSHSAANLGRATKGAAMTLLAKVYLTRKNYQLAANQCQKVIDLGIYSLYPNYADVFLIANKNLRESIFEVQFSSGSGGIGSNFAGFYRPSFDTRPGFGGFGDNPVTLNHYNAYRSGDLRKDVNIVTYSYTVAPKAPATVLYPYYVAKFKDPAALGTASGGNNYIITRYADLLLMQAEALNQINAADPKAYEAFNQVRRRAYGFPVNAVSPADLLPGLSKEQFLDSVLAERRLELAFEGHRRFDLIRTGKLKAAMNAQDPSIVVADRHVLLPVPTLERNTNKLLDQNDGY